MWRAWTTNDAEKGERREKCAMVSRFSWPFVFFVTQSIVDGVRRQTTNI